VAGNTGAHYRQRRVSTIFGTRERRETDWSWPDFLLDVRRCILQERPGLRDWWRRFSSGGIAFSHPIRLQSLFDSSTRQDARVQDHARPRVCEQEDRADLEYSRDEIHFRCKRRDAGGATAQRENQ